MIFTILKHGRNMVQPMAFSKSSIHKTWEKSLDEGFLGGWAWWFKTRRFPSQNHFLVRASCYLPNHQPSTTNRPLVTRSDKIGRKRTDNVNENIFASTSFWPLKINLFSLKKKNKNHIQSPGRWKCCKWQGGGRCSLQNRTFATEGPSPPSDWVIRFFVHPHCFIPTVVPTL